jgi:hypothetical protein
MMFMHATPPVVPQLYATLHFVVHRFREPLFAHRDNSFCELMTYMILNHCASQSTTKHARARALYYWLLVGNYEVSGNFSKVKLQSIIAVSKLLGGGQHSEFGQLQASLQSIAGVNAGALQPLLTAYIAQLVELIGTLVSYQTQIAQSAHDPELLADLYYNISNGYSDSPDLRVAWLENLSQIHVQHGNLAEAAHAKLHQSALVLVYLAHRNVAPLPLDTLLTAVPNHTHERGLPPFDATEFASKVWSEESLVELLQEAVRLMQDAKLYEEAVAIYQMILAVLTRAGNYSDMVPALADFKAVCEALVAANSNQERLPPNFYRVGLYGAAFGAALDGKEFIYKVPPSMTLGHFQKKLTTQFGRNVSNIEVLTTNNDVERTSLDAKKAYLQIGAVKPYTETANADEGAVALRSAVGHVSQFVFEAAHSAGKKALSEDDFSKQQKRKVIFTTQHSMPYLRARVLVVQRSEIILSASDNAIEMMAQRVEKLRDELRFNPPRQNSLQQGACARDWCAQSYVSLLVVIQGSVVPMGKCVCVCFQFTDALRVSLVNGGPIKVKLLLKLARARMRVCALRN